MNACVFFVHWRPDFENINTIGEREECEMALNSIWNNDFYNSMPVPKWCFEMDFTQLFIGQKNKEIYGELLNKAVVSCSWPERQGNSIPVYYAGVEAKLPGRVSNSGELEIKFNENSTFEVTKALEELFHAETSCDAYFEGKGGYSYNKKFSKTPRIIRMMILKPSTIFETNPIEDRSVWKAPVEIRFHNCWLVKIGGEEMSYDNDSEVITKSCTFAYDYFKVLGDGDTQINDECKGDE